MIPSVRFGAIIPIIGEQERAYKLAGEIEQKAKAQGLKTIVSAGPQEPVGYDPTTRRLTMLAGVTVYTGKDADNFEAFKNAEKQASEELQRRIDKQVKEIGHPPDMQSFKVMDDFWKAFGDYEKKSMIWGLFNPDPKIPSPWDFKTIQPENYGDFQDVDTVEQQFKSGSLDISG